MKKLLLAGVLTMAMSSIDASAAITVKVPANSGLDSMHYCIEPVYKLAYAKTNAERGIVAGNIPLVNNEAKVSINSTNGDSRAVISFSPREYIIIYAKPDEEIVAEVTSVSPFDYKLSGTPFVEEMNELEALYKESEKKRKVLRDSGEAKQEDWMALSEEYSQSVKDYFEEKITSPIAVLAILSLRDDDFLKALDRLSERAKTSIVYPLAEARHKKIQASLEIEKKQQEMANGTTPAPAFTLKDLEGKDVSLSDFKGKWVILDFWGSWCIWCIKGFPELKEAYAKYKDKLEVIGIDCNETEEAWKAGVAKYELPWVNVYCPKGNPLFEQYGIQGFPTKAIIDPEGIIKNITTGHDPEFFTKLDELIAK